MIDVYFDERVLEHDTGAGLFESRATPLVAVPELHPENAERIRNMRAALQHGPIAPHLRWHPGRQANLEELETVHDRSYLDSIRALCEAGGGTVTGTTLVSAGSWVPLLTAAGTCLEAADAVLLGRAHVSYALVRPPGHHAQPDRADGYCFVNHAALVAERARAGGIERVAVVDWDVHHGNGTQECFYERADVLTVSLHMQHGSWGPSHPQTGSAAEIGVGDGAGHNVNLELSLGAGDAVYGAAFDEVIAPILREYRPGLIVGACGQDASGFDPNGRQNVSMRGFRRIGRALSELAGSLCDGRLVLVQEGGYARTYAGYCLHATLEGVLGLDSGLDDPLAYVPDDPTRGRAGIDAAKTYLSAYWTF